MDYDDSYTILLLLTEYSNFNDLKILRLVSKDIFYLDLTKRKFVNLQKYITVCTMYNYKTNLDENVKLRVDFNCNYMGSRQCRDSLEKYGKEKYRRDTFEFTLCGFNNALCYFYELDIFHPTPNLIINGYFVIVPIYILYTLSDGHFPIIKPKIDQIINHKDEFCRDHIYTIIEYFKIPEWYIMENISKINIIKFSQCQKLSKNFMKNVDISIQDCYEMSVHHPFTMKQINTMIDPEYSKLAVDWSLYVDAGIGEMCYAVDWMCVLKYNEYLSQKELESLIEYLHRERIILINVFEYISKRKLSIEFMRKWRGFIKWGIHIDHNKLDTDILEEFCEDIRKWSVRIWHKNLDIKFVENHIILLEYVDYITILTERQEPIPSFIVDNIHKLGKNDLYWCKLMTLPEDELTEYLKIEHNTFSSNIYCKILGYRKLSTKFIKDNIYGVFEGIGGFLLLLPSQQMEEWFLDDVLKLTPDFEECLEMILKHQNISEQFIRKHICSYYKEHHNEQGLFSSTLSNMLLLNTLQSEDSIVEIFDDVQSICLRTSNYISQYQKISKEFALKYPHHFNWILLYKYQGYEI